MTPIFFITGINATGKTTIGNALKQYLGTKFVIYDIDQDGVPEWVDDEWRRIKTKEFIDKAQSEPSRVYILTGTTFYSEVNSAKNLDHERFMPIFILLDCAEYETRKRLADRHFTKSCVDNNFKLKEVLVKDLEPAPIKYTIDTDKNSRFECKKKILDIIFNIVFSVELTIATIPAILQ